MAHRPELVKGPRIQRIGKSRGVRRRADPQADNARLNHSSTKNHTGHVPTASDDRCALDQPSLLGSLLSYGPDHFWRINQVREQPRINFQCLQNFPRPLALVQVKSRSRRGIRHLCCYLSSEPVAQPILGQQHPAALLVNICCMVFYP